MLSHSPGHQGILKGHMVPACALPLEQGGGRNQSVNSNDSYPHPVSEAVHGLAPCGLGCQAVECYTPVLPR